jgi:hypothetical protein
MTSPIIGRTKSVAQALAGSRLTTSLLQCVRGTVCRARAAIAPAQQLTAISNPGDIVSPLAAQNALATLHRASSFLNFRKRVRRGGNTDSSAVMSAPTTCDLLPTSGRHTVVAIKSGLPHEMDAAFRLISGDSCVCPAGCAPLSAFSLNAKPSETAMWGSPLGGIIESWRIRVTA